MTEPRENPRAAIEPAAPEESSRPRPEAGAYRQCLQAVQARRKQRFAAAPSEESPRQAEPALKPESPAPAAASDAAALESEKPGAGGPRPAPQAAASPLPASAGERREAAGDEAPAAAAQPQGAKAAENPEESCRQDGAREPETQPAALHDALMPEAPEGEPPASMAGDAPGRAPSEAMPPAGVPVLRALPRFTREKRLGAGLAAAAVLAAGLAAFIAGKSGPGDASPAARDSDGWAASGLTLSLPPVPAPLPADSRSLEKEELRPGSGQAAVPAPSRPAPLVPDIREAARGSSGASPAVPKPASEAEQRYAAPLALQVLKAEPSRGAASGPRSPGASGSGGLIRAKAGSGAARASQLPGRSLLLQKGAVIECVLETRLDTTVPGPAVCVITKDVWSADGRTLLIEKGSKASGEYRGAVQKGLARILLRWDRIVTPRGVALELDSPAADPLGGAGVPGSVDHHWWARFGNALLFSLVQDAFSFGVARETEAAGGVNYYANSTDSMSEIVKEAMAQAGDIPPTLTRPQGSRLSIIAARDLDFSGVYGLEPAEGLEEGAP